MYRYDADPELKTLIDEAAKISSEIAALQRQLGSVLHNLHFACEKKGVRYEDVLKRKAKMTMSTGCKMMRAAGLNLPEGTGFEIQETIAAAKNIEKREAMMQAAKDGKSVSQVKQAGTVQKEEPDETEALAAEKTRIEKTIERLKRRLDAIIERIRKRDEGG